MVLFYSLIILMALADVSGLYSELLMWVIVFSAILLSLVKFSQLARDELSAVTLGHVNPGFIFEELGFISDFSRKALID